MTPVPRAGRLRMSAADRRTQLLDLARDIVADEGFSALTIDRIARAAHVSRTVIYQQFMDLPRLMDALLDRESAIAFAGIGSVAWTEGSDQDVDQVGRGVLAYLHGAPTSWRIILRPTDGAPPELRARIEIGRTYARRVAGRHLSRAVGATVDPDGATVRILLASIEELARLHLDDPREHPDELVLAYLRSLVAWAARAEVGSPTAD
jgi:AcrR family transcriptional regulator